MIPVELVHRPRRDGRLNQRLDASRLRLLWFTRTLLQPRGERVARTSKLCQRQLEQHINVSFEVRSRHCFHPSSFNFPHSLSSCFPLLFIFESSLSLFSALHQLHCDGLAYSLASALPPEGAEPAATFSQTLGLQSTTKPSIEISLVLAPRTSTYLSIDNNTLTIFDK